MTTEQTKKFETGMYSVLHTLYIRSYHDTWDQIWFSCWDSYLSQGKRMVELLEWKDGMNAVVGGQHKWQIQVQGGHAFDSSCEDGVNAVVRGSQEKFLGEVR